MSKRFVFLALSLAVIMLSAYTSLRSETSTIFEVFFWLFLVLVVSGVALWPSTGRDQVAELRLERMSWGDRIQFLDFGPSDGAPARTTAEPGHRRPMHTSRAT